MSSLRDAAGVVTPVQWSLRAQAAVEPVQFGARQRSCPPALQPYISAPFGLKIGRTSTPQSRESGQRRAISTARSWLSQSTME